MRPSSTASSGRRTPRPSGRTRGRLPGRAAAGDVAHRANVDARFLHGLHVPCVETRRREQRLADGLAFELRSACRLSDSPIASKQHAAGERVAVRVEAARSNADHAIARDDALAVDDLRARHDADREAGQVVFAGRVHAGKLCCLAAEQRAAGLFTRMRRSPRSPWRRRRARAFPSRNSRGKTAGRAPVVMMSFTHIPTRSKPIVSCLPVRNATFSLVPTPSVPLTRTGSSMPLGTAQRPAKPPTSREHFSDARRLRERLDALDELITGIDVDAGFAIGDRHARPSSRPHWPRQEAPARPRVKRRIDKAP